MVHGFTPGRAELGEYLSEHIGRTL